MRAAAGGSFSTTINRSLTETTRSTSGISCPRTITKRFGFARTASYSWGASTIACVHSSSPHSQRKSDISSPAISALISLIRSLTSRKSASFLATRCCRLSTRPILGNVYPKDAVGDRHLERLDRQVGGERQGAARPHVEARTVAGADGHAFLGLEIAFGERPVVVRAPVLDRVIIASQVVDADRELAGAHDLHLARRQLGDRAHGQLRHRSTSARDRRRRSPTPPGATSPSPCAARAGGR